MSALTDASRAAFETWLTIERGQRLGKRRPSDGEYEFFATCLYWQAWQASRTQALEEAAQACESESDSGFIFAKIIRSLK